MKNLIIGGGLNSGKGAILRHLAYGDPNIGELREDMLRPKLPHWNLLTDVIRDNHVTLIDSQAQREKEYPKFGQTKRQPKPTTQEILSNLGGVQGWINAEIVEMQHLFRNAIVPILQNNSQQYALVGVGVDPEGLYQYLQKNKDQDPSVAFFVKTKRDIILTRLQQDTMTEIYKSSWPLRLKDIREGVDIIAGFSEGVAEMATKRGFRVVEVPANTDQAFITESQRISALLKG